MQNSNIYYKNSNYTPSSSISSLYDDNDSIASIPSLSSSQSSSFRRNLNTLNVSSHHLNHSNQIKSSINTNKNSYNQDETRSRSSSISSIDKSNHKKKTFNENSFKSQKYSNSQQFTQDQSNIYKNGRVKVGIRCRPAFSDEIELAQGSFFSIVDCISETYLDNERNQLGNISLTLASGKQRDFQFDYVFDSTSSQDDVYERLMKPLIRDLFQGFNASLLCYGQTGTGKTYTLGILEVVKSQNAGLIPRAIADIFSTISSNRDMDSSISMSFLQLYRETIQDLLAPMASIKRSDSSIDAYNDNLPIREDPQRGFYVDGLQEFAVNSFEEAVTLINLGLNNRALAPTLMNMTSSRSHLVLTIKLEQKAIVSSESSMNFAKTIRSKLLMVDLAGSERVRRTVSKGVRLSEAKSINTSLSVLGNVIAALAENNASHIPYRDSKLTRLLQDSLGGTASTALLATIGPAPINYGETLSTLLFASRCMAVKTKLVHHEEVDYADMCTRLQDRLSNIESEMTLKMHKQKMEHDVIVKELHERINQNPNTNFTNISTIPSSSFQLDQLENLFALIQSTTSSWMTTPYANRNWIQNIIHESMKQENSMEALIHSITTLSSLLGYSYEVLVAMKQDIHLVLKQNELNEESRQQKLSNEFEYETSIQQIREMELLAMKSEDNLLHLTNENSAMEQVSHSHIASITYSEAIDQIHSKFPSNNQLHCKDKVKINSLEATLSYPSFIEFLTIDEMMNSLISLQHDIQSDLSQISLTLNLKDHQYDALKYEAINQLVEQRKREEEVMNWSFILKYLLNTSSRLKKELRAMKKQQGHMKEKDDNDDGLIPVPPLSLPLTSTSSTSSNIWNVNIIKPMETTNNISHPITSSRNVSSIESIQTSNINIHQEESKVSLTLPGKMKDNSVLAYQLVEKLGLQGNEAQKAMDIIDTITKYSDEDLMVMEEDVRNQILQMRHDLGIPNSSNSSNTRLTKQTNKSSNTNIDKTNML